MRLVVCPALFLPLAIALGCSKPPAARPEAKPAPVTAATAAKKTVPVQIRTIGSVKAAATVAVRPRVGGQLMEVFFKEGDTVEKDQKLFQIDRRPYDSAVAQAKANLAKNVAIAAGADVELKRVETAGVAGAVAGTELDKARTLFASASASVVADKATIATAELQASFTTITAPLTGRVGELLVNVGNLVEANSVSPLVVINQVSPIYVTFSLRSSSCPWSRRSGG